MILLWLLACTPAPEPPPGVDPVLLPADVRDRLEARLDRELAQGWQPHTPNVWAATGRPMYTNRLIEATSPYLRQHAHDQVSWMAWGPEALELAARTGRPIFLSIGYATCHWCHVMQEESFRDADIAALINSRFVPIKVDRETRPDLDQLYMDAVLAMNGSGGWPATLVLDPAGRPFFATTYVPPHDGDRGRAKGLQTLLQEIAHAWATDRTRIDEVAASLAAHLATDRTTPPAGLPGPTILGATVRAAAESWDAEHGGVAARQRFWSSTPLRALLVAASAGDEEAKALALQTLDAMALGGVYDHVAGGFHRYTVDPAWKIPHFEKMLYDQAQLARIYGEAFQLTGDVRYAAVVEETLEAMVRDLGVDGGGFASATDADSMGPDGHRAEGAFATWTQDELRFVLGDRTDAFAATWVDPEAVVDGRYVLHPRGPLDPAARKAFRKDRLALLLARRQRPAPARDDKVLTAWNGLAISALAYDGWLLRQELWLAEARTAAERLLEARMDGRPVRVAGPGEPGGTAFLDDHAFLLEGLVALFEATGERRWLDDAVALEAVTRARFGMPEGPWAFTPDDGETLLARRRPVDDQALPSPNSALLVALWKLAALTGDDGYRERADAIARGIPFERAPLAFAEGIVALESRHRPLREIVLVTAEGERSSGLHAAIRTLHPSRRVLVQQTEGAPPVVPLAAGKVRLDGPTVYVCQGGVCEQPLTDPATLAALLSGRSRP